MRTRVPLALVALVALACAVAPATHAADVTATDGDSHVTLSTPILAPSTGACTRVPYAYLLAGNVEVATIVIVDSGGGLVARSNQLVPGEGSGELNVCGANLSGTTPPFRLQLRITYVHDGPRPATTATSATFGFAPRTVTCRKASPPHKGRVHGFARKACPRGWTPARR